MSPDQFSGDCRCRDLVSLGEREGRDYVEQHLAELVVDLDNWRVLYQCPVTGLYWRESRKWPEAHGGGIRKYDRIGETEAAAQFGVTLKGSQE